MGPAVRCSRCEELTWAIVWDATGGLCPMCADTVRQERELAAATQYERTRTLQSQPYYIALKALTDIDSGHPAPRQIAADALRLIHEMEVK